MLRTVRHPELSLWQSAVAEVLRGQASAGTDTLHRAVLEDPIMSAVNAHVVAQAETNLALAPPGRAADALEGARAAPDDAAYVSYLAFLQAQASVAGDAATVAALGKECRKYATCDWEGWWECIRTYAAYRKKYSEPLYRDWKALGEDIATYGVIEYRLPRDATVVLLADWGTGLGDARALLADAMRHEPDAVIHLGDIYYSGTPEECRLNVQEIFSRVFEELDMAPVPVFSIPGNHDYYSFGEGFFQLIDTMSGGDPAWQQQASYFCLRTEDDAWQLLGMDTGRQDYWPWSAADPRYDGPSLQPSEIEWHADKLSRQRFAGTTILLSHHQLFSQHSKISNRRRGWMNEHLLGIFEPWFPRVAAWFWGHEHNLALYQDGLYDLTKGRLVGCSAYEESTGETPYSPHSTEFARNVPYREPRVELGHSGDYYAHGYVLLELGDGAHATYFEYPSWGMEEPMQKPKGKPLEKESIRAPQPEPPGGDVVKFGDRLYLGHSMGDHMATFHKGRQYYPTLAATGAVRLELKGGIKTLRHGSTCQIRSTEEDLGKYSYLGAWSLKHDCYYYTKDYDERKQTWRVLKKSNLDDPEIRYGDEVYIQNVYFDGQRLAKDGHYLTTAKDVADCWVFAQGAPMDGGSEAGEVETTAPKEGVAASEMPEPV